MNIKKYSQYNEEDFLLNYFNNLNNGFLVDIGAADGISNSNSRFLIESGWSALLVEPNKKNFEKIKNLYLNNKKIILENIGCSKDTIDSVDFYIDQNDEYEQLSTFSQVQVDKCKKMYNCGFKLDKVNLIKTSELFNKHLIKKIDFLSIDTESFDTNVILGINFNDCEIDLICVEHTSDILFKKLNGYGYKDIHKTIGNTFFSKK